jgi:hypothetical protein
MPTSTLRGKIMVKGAGQMSARVKEGTVVFWKWDEEGILHEAAEVFETLDSLFDFCLTHGDERLVDRIVLNGLDRHGRQRELVLAFSSVTVPVPV